MRSAKMLKLFVYLFLLQSFCEYKCNKENKYNWCVQIFSNMIKELNKCNKTYSKISGSTELANKTRFFMQRSQKIVQKINEFNKCS